MVDGTFNTNWTLTQGYTVDICYMKELANLNIHYMNFIRITNIIHYMNFVVHLMDILALIWVI